MIVASVVEWFVVMDDADLTCGVLGVNIRSIWENSMATDFQQERRGLNIQSQERHRDGTGQDHEVLATACASWNGECLVIVKNLSNGDITAWPANQFRGTDENSGKPRFKPMGKPF